ncbi:MAG: roadblock/LC7 domain-containing protein [Thermoleophilia bacterium]|nr:roadblock/LC7 domain-containing protein [Thermoleophilia bacterium]
MELQVETALKEMLDISADIDKALLFSGDQVLAGNFPPESAEEIMAKARQLVELGDTRAREMGSAALSQLVVQTKEGSVFVVRESEPEELIIVATGRRESRVGLALYDLKTCLRDVREALEAERPAVAESTEGGEG